MTSNELSLHYSKITAAPFKYYKCFSLLNDSRFGGNQQSNGLSLFIDYYYNAFKAISFLRLCFSKTSWSQGVCVCLCTESSTFTMLWWLWVWLPQPAGPLSFAGPRTSLESPQAGTCRQGDPICPSRTAWWEASTWLHPCASITWLSSFPSPSLTLQLESPSNQKRFEL